MWSYRSPGRSAYAVRAPHEPRVAAPAAAPQHPIGAPLRRPYRVDHRIVSIPSRPVQAPLPDVAQHVVQAPGIRQFLRDGMRSGPLVIVLFVRPAGRIVAVLQLEIDAAVAAVPGDRVQAGSVVLAQDLQWPGVGRRFRTRTAGVFPLGFGRQGEVQILEPVSVDLSKNRWQSSQLTCSTGRSGLL